MLPNLQDRRTGWLQGGLAASCVRPREESQSTDQMPVHESPAVDHMGSPHSSQRALPSTVIPKSPSVRKEAGVSRKTGKESFLQDLGNITGVQLS